MKVGDRESILKRIEELKISQQKCTSDFFYWGYVGEIEDLEKQLKELPNVPLTPKPFTKDDLKDFMVCITKGKEEIIYYKGKFLHHDCINLDFDNNLQHIENKYWHKDSHFDIMQVTYNNEIVFKKEEKPYEFEMNYGYVPLERILEDLKSQLHYHDFSKMNIQIIIKEVK